MTNREASRRGMLIGALATAFAMVALVIVYKMVTA